MGFRKIREEIENIIFDYEFSIIGGQVLAMRWDPSGERLVVSFHDSNLVALFGTRITPAGILVVHTYVLISY